MSKSKYKKSKIKNNEVIDVENLDTIFPGWNDLEVDSSSLSFISKDNDKKSINKKLKKRRDNNREILNELASLIPIHGLCPSKCSENCSNNALGADTCMLLKYAATYMTLKMVINGPRFGICRTKLINKCASIEAAHLFNSTNSILIIISDSFECLYISMNIYHTTGVTQASIIGNSIVDFIHPNDLPNLFKHDNIPSNCKRLGLSLVNQQSNQILESLSYLSIQPNQCNNQKTYQPYENLTRNSTDIRFKSYITENGSILDKQGPFCYKYMNLVYCIHHIPFIDNYTSINDNVNLQRRYLVGLLLPLNILKNELVDSPSSPFFISYHRACLSLIKVSQNVLNLNQTDVSSWYDIVSPCYLRKLRNFHHQIISNGFASHHLFQLKQSNIQLVSKGFLVECSNCKCGENSQIVLYHEIIGQPKRINKKIEHTNNQNVTISLSERIPYVLSANMDESLNVNTNQKILQ